MGKILSFIFKYKITITVCVLMFIFGIGYWISAAAPTKTTIGDDIIVKGSVGIGTDTPAYELDVAGDLRVTGNVIATGNTRDNCAWTSWTCNAAQSCASPKFVAGVERYTTGTLCGSLPKQWYQMRLNCCDL